MIFDLGFVSVRTLPGKIFAHYMALHVFEGVVKKAPWADSTLIY